MGEIMYQSEDGDVIVTYHQWDLGMKYRAKRKSDWRSMVAFGTYGEAMNYAKKLERGGM